MLLQNYPYLCVSPVAMSNCSHGMDDVFLELGTMNLKLQSDYRWYCCRRIIYWNLSNHCHIVYVFPGDMILIFFVRLWKICCLICLGSSKIYNTASKFMSFALFDANENWEFTMALVGNRRSEANFEKYWRLIVFSHTCWKQSDLSSHYSVCMLACLLDCLIACLWTVIPIIDTIWHSWLFQLLTLGGIVGFKH